MTRDDTAKHRDASGEGGPLVCGLYSPSAREVHWRDVEGQGIRGVFAAL